MSNCIIHTGAKSDGYGVLKRLGRAVRSHRWAYVVANKLNLSDIDGYIVMHTCDVRACINPDHLKLGTHADNQADKVLKNRQAKGENIGNSKLKKSEVIDIKDCILSGYSNRELADSYNVHPMTISKIRSGKTWKHIPWGVD